MQMAGLGKPHRAQGLRDSDQDAHVLHWAHQRRPERGGLFWVRLPVFGGIFGSSLQISCPPEADYRAYLQTGSVTELLRQNTHRTKSLLPSLRRMGAQFQLRRAGLLRRKYKKKRETHN